MHGLSPVNERGIASTDSPPILPTAGFAPCESDENTREKGWEGKGCGMTDRSVSRGIPAWTIIAFERLVCKYLDLGDQTTERLLFGRFVGTLIRVCIARVCMCVCVCVCVYVPTRLPRPVNRKRKDSYLANREKQVRGASA